jgi:hypothetical protein
LRTLNSIKRTCVAGLLTIAALMAFTALAPVNKVSAQVNTFYQGLPTALDKITFKFGESGFGAKNIVGTNTELMTLSTGGTTTDSTANLLPANSIIESVTGVVTTAITGSCTGWTLADGTTAGRFAASNTTLTAGAASIGIVQWSGAVSTLAAGPSQPAADKVRIVCAGGAATTGAVRVTVTYRQPVADFQ